MNRGIDGRDGYEGWGPDKQHRFTILIRGTALTIHTFFFNLKQ